MSDDTRTPLDGAAQARIGFFVSLMLPAIALGVGVLPAVVLLWGWFMMRRHRDFAYVQTSATVCRGLLFLVLAGCAVVVVVNAYEYHAAGVDESWLVADRRERALEYGLTSLIVACFPLGYLFALSRLYLSPLLAHREWVEAHGVLASKVKSGSRNEVDIIKGEKPASYSVADELMKWVALKENGHITDEEFNEARRKLLQKP